MIYLDHNATKRGNTNAGSFAKLKNPAIKSASCKRRINSSGDANPGP